ncbi:MAG: hypothetical protein AMXMBFR64_52140 [Myxococcales bacterium]
MSSKFLGVALLVALCGAPLGASAQAPEPARPATDAERTARMQEERERRAAAAAERGIKPSPTPADLSPEARERLLRERRARAANLTGERAERLRAIGARETALAGRNLRPVSPELEQSRMELRLASLQNAHNRRVAQLRRIRALAEQAKDAAAVARADSLLTKEQTLYDTQVTAVKDRKDGAALRPPVRPGLRVEGRPVAERPLPARPVPARPTPQRPEGAAGGER